MSSFRTIRATVFGPLLAAVFAAANLGLPAADVLLDHRLDGSAQAAQAHLEGRNGCREHTDHCPLSRILGAVRLQAPAASALELAPAADPAPLDFARMGDPFFLRQPPYFSRAPPQAA